MIPKNVPEVFLNGLFKIFLSVFQLVWSQCSQPGKFKMYWTNELKMFLGGTLRCPIKSSKMYHNQQISGKLSEHCKYMLRKLENSEHFVLLFEPQKPWELLLAQRRPLYTLPWTMGWWWRRESNGRLPILREKHGDKPELISKLKKYKLILIRIYTL